MVENTIDDDILTLPEVAKNLRISIETVVRMIKQGKLRGGKIGGQWRIKASELERYKAEVLG